jgi:hypothetical protein
VSSEAKDIGNVAFGFIFGVTGFFWGFTRFRRKRLIENIPTSTVRGLAMGLTELIGNAHKKIELKSPFSFSDCVLYTYTIERYERGNKSSHWVNIAKGDSFYAPFYLQDDTGKVLVAPKGAELILPIGYEFQTGLGVPPPSNLIQFMEAHAIKYRSLFGTHTLRFREWLIRPEDTVYVLGYAQKSKDFLNEHNEKLVRRLQELKDNPVKMSEVDTNKDGQVNIEEWDTAVVRVEKDLLDEELKFGQPQELADVAIGKGQTEKVFIISKSSQKDLLKSLFWQSLLGIFGGGVLAVVCFLGLLMYFKVI